MQRINYPQPKEWDEILKRPTQTVADIEEVVNSIFREVQSDGDTVIKKYTAQFDKIDLDSLVVSNSEIQKANDSVSDAWNKPSIWPNRILRNSMLPKKQLRLK